MVETKTRRTTNHIKGQKVCLCVCGGGGGGGRGGGGRAGHISKTRQIVGIKEEKILDAAGERMRQ